MKVRIETLDIFMGTVNVYFYEQTPSGTFVYYTGQEENGTVFWRREHVAEGTVMTAPTLQISRDMLEALQEALSPLTVKADEELVRRLRLEEGRVDKMMDLLGSVVERRLM